jgi:hypothetical protein
VITNVAISALAAVDLSFFRLLDGDTAKTEAVCAEGIALARELSDRFTTAYFLASFAGVRSAQGHGARPTCTEGTRGHRPGAGPRPCGSRRRERLLVTQRPQLVPDHAF